MRGWVKWWNDAKGYGFLGTTKGEDVFVHYSAIRAPGFKSLTEGQLVEFEVTGDPKHWQAANVRLAEEPDSPTAPAASSSVQPNRRKLSVFLCHSSSDKPAVRELFSRLAAVPYVSPWLDEKNLLPGQDWNLEITRAVRASDCVVVCISKGAINREGYVQKEIGFALDSAQEKPEGTIFLIPVRLEPCDPPERLARWHYVDLYEKTGFDRLLLSLQYRATNLGLLLSDLADAKGEVASAKVEVVRLTRENQELAARLAQRDSARPIFVDGAYRFEGEEGHFCTACLDVRQQRVRLTPLQGAFTTFGRWECPSCKAILS